ncbi:phosphatidylinositol synthase [Mycena leptocephala]|nr:phosphatidylinositol synthase [Mycena leptocephala]
MSPRRRKLKTRKRSRRCRLRARPATAQSENVFLFVPNLIGYTRVVLVGMALLCMRHHPIYCTITYCVSCLFDAVDGYAARALDQTSRFGAVLDMVIDRCTTSCLLCYLFSAYPDYALCFQFLIALDFSSHYMHMYSSLVTGSSHKHVKNHLSRILRWYYNVPVRYILIIFHHPGPKCTQTLFVVCFVNEPFFISLYLMRWSWAATPIGLPWSSVASLTYPQLFALCSFPGCVTKNIVNIVQLWEAAEILGGVDVAERRLRRRG